MKKVFAILLVLAMTLLFVGCGVGSQSSAPAAENGPSDSASGIFEAEGRKYITADQLKADLESGKDIFLLDLQPEENYNEHHLKGAVATYAFPVETDAEKAAIDTVLPDAQGKVLVIVCPGGKKGANNTWDYLTDNGYDMSTVFILENGQNGWLHAELLADGEDAVVSEP